MSILLAGYLVESNQLESGYETFVSNVKRLKDVEIKENINKYVNKFIIAYESDKNDPQNTRFTIKLDIICENLHYNKYDEIIKIIENEINDYLIKKEKWPTNKFKTLITKNYNNNKIYTYSTITIVLLLDKSEYIDTEDNTGIFIRTSSDGGEYL